MNGLDLFPIKVFESQIDQVDSFNLLNEILRNQDEMKIISSTRQEQSIEEYITDYPYNQESKVVQLETLDKIFDDIKSIFTQWNSSFEVINYWTAVYIKNGHHGLHNHSNGVLDRCNYSGIIYLSDLGETTFFSTSPSSFESTFVFKSKMGKVLIFPSTLPHMVHPTLNGENSRYVVAFNCEIRNK